MTHQKIFAIASLVLVTSMSTYAATTPAPATGAPAQPSKGTQIGKLITDGINAALPGVGSLATDLINIFKPKASDVAAAKPTVDAAVANTKSSVGTSIAQQLKVVEPIAKQLDTLGPFLEYGFSASADLSELTGFLAANPTPDTNDWKATIKPKWAGIRAALDSIAYTDSAVQASVKDADVQQLLLKILKAKAVNAASIDSLVSSSTATGLPDALSKLASSLSTLDLVARIQISSLADGIHSLAQASVDPATKNLQTPTAQGGVTERPHFKEAKARALTILSPY